MSCAKSAKKSSEILNTSNIDNYDGGGLGSIPVESGDGLNEVIQYIDESITNITNLISGVSDTSGITYDGTMAINSCLTFSGTNLNTIIQELAGLACNAEKAAQENASGISSIQDQVNDNTAGITGNDEDIAELDAKKHDEADAIAKDGYRNIDGWFSPRDTDYTFAGTTATVGDGSGGNIKGYDTAGQWVDLPEETVNLVATRDNYVDIDKTAIYVTDVAIGSPAPARATIAASRLFKAETDATSVVSSTDLRQKSYIREDDIDDGAITSSKLAAGAVDSTSLENVVTAGSSGDTDLLSLTYDAKGRITASSDKLQLGTLADGDVLAYDNGLGKWVNKQLDLSSEILSIAVDITSAEILASNTTPVTLIPAPAAGFFLDIISVTGKVSYGTTPYATNTTNLFQMGGTNSAPFITTKLLTATTNSFFKLQPQTLTGSTHYKEQSPFEFLTNVGDPTAGDSDFKIYISYRVVPV